MSELNENTNKKPGGPKTPEGKNRSSLNSVRHGLTAQTIVLPQEDREKWEELLSDYIHEYQPATKLELDLVHELAANRWRLQRLWGVETSVIDVAVQRRADQVNQEFRSPSPDVHVAMAYQDLFENSKTLTLINRYETRLTRRFHQVLGELEKLQSARKAEQQRQLTEKKAVEAGRPAEISETPGDPKSCRVLLSIPKALLRNELPQPIPITRRDEKIQPKEDDAA